MVKYWVGCYYYKKAEMSTLLSLKKPCFEYKSSFKTSKFEKVKLKQNFDNGTTKTKECPVFTGEFGIESLLYIEVCTIVTPYGKYQYCRMAMGLKTSPDVAQAMIEKILDGLDVDAYIDDIGIFSNSWEDHMKIIDAVLHRLQENGMKVNPLKCEWCVQETDFLGYWLTPTGLA